MIKGFTAGNYIKVVVEFLVKIARQVNKYNEHEPQCTMVDGASIAAGREVTEDRSRYGTASSRNVKFTPAHI